MNALKIEIAGGTNCGKSTVAYLIEQALTDNGINFSYKIGDRELAERSDTFYMKQGKRIAHLKDNLKVEISTKQINRQALSIT